MLEMFKSETFWAAFSALVAFTALAGSIGGGLIAFLKAKKWRSLQAILNKERQFYEEQARRVTREPIQLPEESALDQYLNSIQNGLLAITNLTGEQIGRAKDKLRDLIAQLQSTHATLVKALALFTTNDAKKFFDEFNDFNQTFGELYNQGHIPHNARTHCGDVVATVDEIVNKLKKDDFAAAVESPEQDAVNKIESIKYSMEYADQDLIVPIMLNILSKTEIELSLINSAIRDGDMKKAIWLKERYRFDTEKLYFRINDALERMSALRLKL